MKTGTATLLDIDVTYIEMSYRHCDNFFVCILLLYNNIIRRY